MTAPEEPRITAVAKISKEEEVSELVNRVAELSSTNDWWNDWGLRLLVLTALIGLLSAYFSVMGSRSSKELSVATNELTDLKEAALQKDIAEARAKQAEAERGLLELQDKLVRQGSRSALLY